MGGSIEFVQGTCVQAVNALKRSHISILNDRPANSVKTSAVTCPYLWHLQYCTSNFFCISALKGASRPSEFTGLL